MGADFLALVLAGRQANGGLVRLKLVRPADLLQSFSPTPPDAADTVRGTAEDFCLLVTQRREPEHTALEFTGEAAHWATFAQAFAGAPKSAVRGRA